MPASPIHSRAAIMGHPLHPVLIHFPVAALLMLIATDGAYLLTGDFFWARAGVWLAAVGAVGGALSGIAGLIDLTTVARIRELVTAWCHSILAVMLLSLATLNWMLRFEDPAAHIMPWGAYLSLLTGGLIAITGFLGGRLVYEYAVGVDIKEATTRKVRP